MGWVVFYFFLVVIIFSIIISITTEKIDGATAENKKWMENNEFEVSSSITYSNSSTTAYSIYIDETNRKLLVLNLMTKERNVINFEDILGMEIVEDGTSTNSVGRAVVGGVLFGGVGAIVGAATAKRVVKNITILLYINSITSPKIELYMNNSKIKTNSLIYRKKMEFAKKLEATIRVILSQNQSQ